MERTIDECFFQIQNGANIKQGDAEGGFPITRIETTANDKFNRDRMGYAGITDISKYESYVLEDGDLLMSHINSVQYLGRTVLYEKENDETIIHGMNLLRLKARRNIINPAYARYCFYAQPFRSQIANITKKSVNQASFAVTDLKKIKIDVPEIEVQNAIVDKLDRIRGVIEQRSEELVQLDKLIKARFIEMFDLDGCSYGTFGNDTDFVDYRGKTPELSDEGTIRMVNAKSVGKGSFKDVNEYVTEQTYNDWMHRGFGYPGDILFVTEGHTFGNTCLVPYYLTKFALGQRVITIKGHSKIVDNTFLCAYMQTEQFRKDIDVFRTGGTAQGIRSKDLVKVRIPLPSVEKQKQFADFVHQVDKSKVAVQKALDETQTLFDSLMQEYFG